jgi:hypothetical protein
LVSENMPRNLVHSARIELHLEGVFYQTPDRRVGFWIGGERRKCFDDNFFLKVDRAGIEPAT